MDTLINSLIWFAITAAMVGLVWLYGASWRAVANALAEAAQRSAKDVPPVSGNHIDGADATRPLVVSVAGAVRDRSPHQTDTTPVTAASEPQHLHG